MHRNQLSNPLSSTQRFEEHRVAAAPPAVRLLVILDHSLSMAPQEELVAEALRSFVNTLRNAPNQPRYVATLVRFAAKVETIFLAQPIEKLAIAYKAEGEGTALCSRSRTIQAA